jgi:ABC-2 type transport system permease protein
MFAVFKRELAAMLQTVTGWLYIAATIALFSLYFYAITLSEYGEPLLAATLSSISFILLITVPVLTMRSLSEERRTKTDQLLLTAPIPVMKIVAAKYLAPAAIHTITVAIMGVAPVIVLANGGGGTAQNYVSLLGFWLYGLACLAIGVFVSSLSESQVIAAVLTFVFLFLGYMMSSITGLITGTDWFSTGLKKVMGSFDLVTPLNTFFDGCISLSGVIYYLTLCALFVFLTVQVIQKRRWSVSSKRWSLSAFSAGFVGIAVALAVFVNLLAQEIPSTVSQIDVTANQLYSLTDTTKEYLATLDKDVTIYVIGTENSVDTTVRQTLQKFADTTDHIKYEYQDPYTNPTFYQQYTQDNISLGTLIVVCGEVSKVIDYNNLFQSEVDYETYQTTTTGYDGEGQLDSAIQYVTSDSRPVIYQLEGHDETAMAGNFQSAIEKANATLQSLTLLTSEGVPEDAQAVIVNGPLADLSSDDATKLIDYINSGGNLMVSVNAQATVEMPNLAKVLAEFSVSTVPGMIFENDSSMHYQGQPSVLLPTVASTGYTSSAAGKYVLLPYTIGFSHPDTVEGVEFTPLMTTSDSAVSKTDLNNATTTEFEEGDVQGPFDVGLAAVKTIDDKTATLVAIGSTLMLDDNADSYVSGSNSALFADTMTTLAAGGSGEGAVVVPVKAYDQAQVTISAMSGFILAVILIGVVPLVLLGAGVLIWLRRRKS